jgi:hypothetical protein
MTKRCEWKRFIGITWLVQVANGLDDVQVDRGTNIINIKSSIQDPKVIEKCIIEK